MKMTESLTSLTASEISTPAAGPASRVTLTLFSSKPSGVNDCASQLKTLSQPMVQSLKVCNLLTSNIERMIVETERAIGLLKQRDTIEATFTKSGLPTIQPPRLSEI